MAHEPIESITEVSSAKRKPSAADFLHFVQPLQVGPFTGARVSLRPEDFLRLVHEGSSRVFQAVQRNFHWIREESNEAHQVCQRALQVQRDHNHRIEQLRDRVIQNL